MPNFGDMFGDIKSKLGLGGGAQGQQYDEYDEYEDYSDEYDEYDGYDDYGNGYNTRNFGNRNTVTTREARGGSMPRLVSYDEARTSTRFAGSGSSYRSEAASTSRSLGRTMVDSSLPPAMTPEGTAQVSAAASRKRSEGLDSLFSSTSGSRDGYDQGARQLPVIGAGTGKPAGVFDPYETPYGSGSAGSVPGQRRVTVLRPVSYEDVSGVASNLRSGDAVVLAFSATPADLFKRILDFSFGVASALDASVDSLGNKVYAITCGAGLSEAERATLRSQGVL